MRHKANRSASSVALQNETVSDTICSEVVGVIFERDSWLSFSLTRRLLLSGLLPSLPPGMCGTDDKQHSEGIPQWDTAGSQPSLHPRVSTNAVCFLFLFLCLTDIKFREFWWNSCINSCFSFRRFEDEPPLPQTSRPPPSLPHQGTGSNIRFAVSTNPVYHQRRPRRGPASPSSPAPVNTDDWLTLISYFIT